MPPWATPPRVPVLALGPLLALVAGLLLVTVPVGRYYIVAVVCLLLFLLPLLRAAEQTSACRGIPVNAAAAAALAGKNGRRIIGTAYIPSRARVGRVAGCGAGVTYKPISSQEKQRRRRGRGRGAAPPRDGVGRRAHLEDHFCFVAGTATFAALMDVALC